MIPKIIWQTYETDYKDLPNKAKNMTESWKENNSSWTYRYVSGKEREKFVKEYFGDEWFTIYNSYKINVMRADIWRYMCLYINGGVYSDIDILCKKPIENWLDLGANFVVSEEPNFPGYTQMLFASEPNSIFLKNILQDIKDQYYSNTSYSDTIEYETKETGYIIFNSSILNTSKVKEEGFISFVGEDSKIIHEESIHHYCAGNGNIFDNSYQAWKRERI